MKSGADWQRRLEAALAAEPDHISAYALIVDEGTRLAGQVRRGQLSMTWPTSICSPSRYSPVPG